MAHYHLPPRPSGKAAGGGRAPARRKYLWKEHGGGHIITSPRCASVPADLIWGMKLKRASCQRGKALSIPEQRCSHPARSVWIGHAPWHLTLPQLQLRAALTSPPRHGKAMSRFCFLGKSLPSVDLPGQWGLRMRLQRGGLNVEGLLHAVNAEIIQAWDERGRKWPHPSSVTLLLPKVLIWSSKLSCAAAICREVWGAQNTALWGEGAALGLNGAWKL